MVNNNNNNIKNNSSNSLVFGQWPQTKKNIQSYHYKAVDELHRLPTFFILLIQQLSPLMFQAAMLRTFRSPYKSFLRSLVQGIWLRGCLSWSFKPLFKFLLMRFVKAGLCGCVALWASLSAWVCTQKRIIDISSKSTSSSSPLSRNN